MFWQVIMTLKLPKKLSRAVINPLVWWIKIKQHKCSENRPYIKHIHTLTYTKDNTTGYKYSKQIVLLQIHHNKGMMLDRFYWNLKYIFRPRSYHDSYKLHCHLHKNIKYKSTKIWMEVLVCMPASKLWSSFPALPSTEYMQLTCLFPSRKLKLGIQPCFNDLGWNQSVYTKPSSYLSKIYFPTSWTQ